MSLKYVWMKVKKINFAVEQDMNAQRGSIDIALLFL